MYCTLSTCNSLHVFAAADVPERGAGVDADGGGVSPRGQQRHKRLQGARLLGSHASSGVLAELREPPAHLRRPQLRLRSAAAGGGVLLRPQRPQRLRELPHALSAVLGAAASFRLWQLLLPRRGRAALVHRPALEGLNLRRGLAPKAHGRPQLGQRDLCGCRWREFLQRLEIVLGLARRPYQHRTMVAVAGLGIIMWGISCPWVVLSGIARLCYIRSSQAAASLYLQPSWCSQCHLCLWC
mmetsp:Transcript_6886/g.19482  ORF Transcript_6886/g.19482 Transcript_6886/m.19482 type:complete len:240 (-) Transcript_6886:195-914(-)